MGAWIYGPQQAGTNWILSLQESASSGVPQLSSPGFGAVTQTTVQGEVVTDAASGTLYALASANSSEPATSVKSQGVPSAVAAAGLQFVSLSGLAPGTSYFVHWLHNAGGIDSAVLTAGPVTTSPVVTLTTSIFRNWAGNALPNMNVEHVLAISLTRSVILSLANQVTNSQGRLVLAGGQMQAGVPVMLATWNEDGSVRGFEVYTPA